MLPEEAVDGVPGAPPPDPDYMVALQVVDDGEVAVAPAVGDLVDADPFQAPYPVSLPEAFDAAVEDVGDGGCG